MLSFFFQEINIGLDFANHLVSSYLVYVHAYNYLETFHIVCIPIRGIAIVPILSQEVKAFLFQNFFNVKINYIHIINLIFSFKEGHPQLRLHPRDPPVRNCQKSRWSTLTQRRKKPKKWKLQLVSQNLHQKCQISLLLF